MIPQQLRASFHGIAISAAEGDQPSREIVGLAAPYNVTTTESGGITFRLAPGSLPIDGPAPKVYLYHDQTQAIGVAAQRVPADDGVLVALKISQTPLGDQALTLAADGVLDGLSVGLDVEDGEYDADGVLVVTKARWREVSLVPYGAFQEARVHSVAASEPDPLLPAEENPTQPNQPSEEEEMSIETPAVLATVPSAPLYAAAPKKLTAAEYLSAVVSGRVDVLRAAENGTGDVPGILPDPLIRDVYDSLSPARPFVSAVGVYAAPNAEVWYRRKITQHVDVDVQAAEFDDLASQALEISKLPVNNQLVGGFIDLSEQVIDWSEPSMVNLVLRDMTKIYAKRTETLACAALISGATVTDTIADFTDGDEILDALYDAAATISDATDELPTHVFLSPDRWADLGKAKAANGDRILPSVGPSNAAGTMNPGSFTVAGLGLTFVVSNRFAAGSMVVGNPAGIELFEQNKGTVRVDQPANASVRMAVRGYFASLVIDSGAFVKFIV
jgi:HK97 family phage prohead protease